MESGLFIRFFCFPIFVQFADSINQVLILLGYFFQIMRVNGNAQLITMSDRHIRMVICLIRQLRYEKHKVGKFRLVVEFHDRSKLICQNIPVHVEVYLKVM